MLPYTLQAHVQAHGTVPRTELRTLNTRESDPSMVGPIEKSPHDIESDDEDDHGENLVSAVAPRTVAVLFFED